MDPVRILSAVYVRRGIRNPPDRDHQPLGDQGRWCPAGIRYGNSYQEPDDRIAWRSTDGKSHAGIIRFTPLDANHTKVKVHFEWAPETLTEKARAALKIDEMQVKTDMRKFKEFIVARGTETGAWRGDVEDSGPTGQP